MMCNRSIYDHSTPLSIDLSLLKFCDIFKLFCVCYIYKIFNNNNNTFDYLKEYILNCQCEHGYNTRFSLLRLPALALERSKQSMAYQGTMIWNILPDNITHAQNKIILKKKCKEHFLS